MGKGCDFCVGTLAILQQSVLKCFDGVIIQIYPTLIADEHNRKLLKLIEQSLFVLCLDRGDATDHDFVVLPDSKAKATKFDRGHVIDRMFHGGGSRQNSPNRWYDK